MYQAVCRELSCFDTAEGTHALRSKLPESIQRDCAIKWAKYERMYLKHPPLAFFTEAIKIYRNRTQSQRHAPVGTRRDRGFSATATQCETDLHGIKHSASSTKSSSLSQI